MGCGRTDSWCLSSVRIRIANPSCACSGTDVFGVRTGYHSGLYRELLNDAMSPGFRQQVVTRITQLHKISPEISAEQLNAICLGANNRPAQRQTEMACEQCLLVFAD
jgi:hypothetical protein